MRTVLGLILLLSGVSSVQAQPSATVPPEFADTLLATVGSPTALAFTPDGRLLITTQTGRLRIYNGSLLSTPALNFTTQWPTNRLCSNSERGLLGVAVDPNFDSNNYIYLYYTYNKFNNSCPTNSATSPVNRVARFILPASNTIVTTTETVLLDNIPSLNGNHNGGDLHFGADGLLYISVGESGTGGSLARVKTNLAGKILRIESDGDIPPSNPFIGDANSWRCGNPAGGSGTGSCHEIYAFGLRNPFRFAFRPGTNQFYINDVGQGTWEEIDNGQSGADYGWNCYEGTHTCLGCSAPGRVDPIYEYNHDDGCYAITGGVFVPTGVWPPPYSGAYLFGDYGCDSIFRLVPPGGSYTSAPFATNLGALTTMVFGPYNSTQALYYANYNSQIRRISYITNNTAPTAVVSANPNYGAVPLLVTLNATGSADADAGDTITFDWNFGDGAVLTGTTSITATHSYTASVPTVYTATLTVRDNHNATSSPASVQIYAGNTAPPVPSIILPTVSTKFAVGQVITLNGSATDSQDGSLPGSSLSWQALLHHIDQSNPGNAHTHPYLPPTTGYTTTLTGPAPEDQGAIALSYLELQLTATDSLGLSNTITQTLQPNRVNVSFATNPLNLGLVFNNTSITPPQTVLSWQGYGLNVFAPGQLDAGGQWQFFANWSDGGAIAHTILTPSSAMTYTATFQPGFGFVLPILFK
jgi:glucose/arabinose dehydrogenase